MHVSYTYLTNLYQDFKLDPDLKLDPEFLIYKGKNQGDKSLRNSGKSTLINYLCETCIAPYSYIIIFNKLLKRFGQNTYHATMT